MVQNSFFFSVKKVNKIFIPNYPDIIPKYRTNIVQKDMNKFNEQTPVFSNKYIIYSNVLTLSSKVWKESSSYLSILSTGLQIEFSWPFCLPLQSSKHFIRYRHFNGCKNFLVHTSSRQKIVLEKCGHMRLSPRWIH